MKQRSKKSRAILEDELMPDGARSSDEDRRRAKKKQSSLFDEVRHMHTYFLCLNMNLVVSGI